MHTRLVSHRDIKLENVLVDSSDMTLKVADFGYANQQMPGHSDVLKSYRGTFTYMAPEIKEGRQYSGQKADIFSTGVVLFILVRGIFPFKEARREEYFYNLLSSGQYQEYWSKVESQHLSAEFKDLIQRLLSYDVSLRPNIEEIRAHPWMLKGSSVPAKTIQSQLVQLVQQHKEHEREAQLK